MPADASPTAAPLLLAVLGRGVVDPSVPVIAATDEGFTRGDGCFEGCRIVDGTVAKLDAHLARMARSAAGLELPFDPGAWRAFVENAVALWTEPGEAALKLVLTRGAPSCPPSGLLSITAFPAEHLRQRRDGVAVVTLCRGTASTTFTGAPWLLGGVKTLSYAVNMAAQREAHRRGADDAVFVSSDGFVLEAPTSSLVWSVGNSLSTTTTAGTGILGGTTQALLFARAADAGWQTRETLATVDEIVAADSCWLVSTVRGPVDVVRIDGRPRPRDLARTAAIRGLCGF